MADPRTDQRSDPKFARESFTWRRMKPWHIVALVIALAVFAAIAFALAG